MHSQKHHQQINFFPNKTKTAAKGNHAEAVRVKQRATFKKHINGLSDDRKITLMHEITVLVVSPRPSSSSQRAIRLCSFDLDLNASSGCDIDAMTSGVTPSSSDCF